jgi:hypothetical protein
MAFDAEDVEATHYGRLPPRPPLRATRRWMYHGDAKPAVEAAAAKGGAPNSSRVGGSGEEYRPIQLIPIHHDTLHRQSDFGGHLPLRLIASPRVPCVASQ